MLFMGTLSEIDLITLVVFHFVFALTGFGYEMHKTNGRFTFSTTVWALVLFGLPILGILIYVFVKVTALILGSKPVEN